MNYLAAKLLLVVFLFCGSGFLVESVWLPEISDLLNFPFGGPTQDFSSVKPLAPNLTIDPIIILPGTPGSYLSAKLHDDLPPHFFCRHNTNEWFPIWPPAKSEFYPGFVDCWSHNLQVQYNATSNTWSNTTGVEIEPIDFGGMNGTYFQNFTAYFQKAAGYEIGKTIFAATFDWRVDGNGATQIGGHEKLKQLVETAYNLNQKKVHLLGHSGGAQYGLYFLSHYVTQAWKDQYINTYITMGGPWLGSSMASAFLANPSLFFPHINQTIPADILKAFLLVGVDMALPEMFMPSEKLGDQLIISTKSRNYTAVDSFQLLQDANRTVALSIRKNNINDYNNILPPQTIMHCIHGEGFATPETYVFADDNFLNLSTILNTTGDTIVSTESGTYCQNWSTQQKQPVYLTVVNNVSHSLMQNSPVIWQIILNITTHQN